MKKYFTVLSIILGLNVAIAQQTDTVSLDSNLTNQAYYSLENGIQANVAKNDWDIAFETTTQGYSILINSATGTKLYEYPGDTTDFTTLDTTGMSAWTQLYNSDTSWGYGAFSSDQSGFSVGWGEYNLTTHQIIGDKVFLIKLSNETYQQIWIKSLIGGVYTFRHATLNNSMDMVHTMAKSSFTGKNFGHYSLQNHGHVMKEPLAESWDLFFGQYIVFIPSEYLVSGVLQKAGVKASKAYPVNDPSTYVDFGAHTFATEVNILGYDWKSFNMSTFQYDIADSTVYFVKTVEGDIWKIIFTGFGGGTTGDFIFTKENLFNAGISENRNVKFFEVYPNPATDRISVNFDISENAELIVTNLTGQKVMSMVLSAESMQETVDVSGLQRGIYLITIVGDNEIVSEKVIIQ